jgi:MFS family permease
MLDYGTRDLGLSRTTMLTAVLISSVFQIFALPAFAAVSDRVSRRRVYLAGAVLVALWVFPMFWLIDTRSFVLITVALVVGNALLSIMYGPQAALFAEMFSARVRYSGASVGYQLGRSWQGALPVHHDFAPGSDGDLDVGRRIYSGHGCHFLWSCLPDHGDL